MKTKFLWVAALGTVCLFPFAGCCRWFADNPMFPTAKVAITFQVLSEGGEAVPTNQLGILPVTEINQSSSESGSTNIVQDTVQETTIVQITSQTASETITETQYIQSLTVTNTYSSEDTVDTDTNITFARSVKFTFNPRNAVGGQIEKCTIEYYDDQGSLIPTLKKVLAIFVEIPADISKSATVTLEIFDKGVEDHYLSHNLISGYAVVKFEGTDYAGHYMAFKTSVPISVYLPEVEIESINVSTIGTTGGTCAPSYSCR